VPDCWPPEMVTLKIADPFGAQQRRVLGVLDAFGHRSRPEPVDETEQMTEKNSGLRPAREIANQRAIDFDDIDRQHLKMPQRGMAGTKIVKRNAASGLAQCGDKARRFCDVTQCCGLRDFDDEAAGDVAAVTQQRSQRPQPRPIASGHPGNVQAEPDFRVSGELLDRFSENVAVNQADPAESLDDGDKLATGDDVALFIAHPQQTFEVIDLSRRCAYHRLERKKQAVLAKCRFHRRANSRPAPIAGRSVRIGAHVPAAPSSFAYHACGTDRVAGSRNRQVSWLLIVRDRFQT